MSNNRNHLIRPGEWVVISLKLPGCDPSNAGILLLDIQSDELFIALRELEPAEAVPDVTEFWEGLSDLLLSMTLEIGGQQTLDWLESNASHIVQIGMRESVAISDPAVVLQQLLKQQVVSLLPKARFDREQLEAARNRLPVLPAAAVQIIAALNNPLSDSRNIESAISRDPILAAHIVRLSNLAGLPFREPVRSLGSAIQRIGIDLTRLHVLALTVGKMFSAANLREIWDHSIHTAQIARQLALLSRCAQDEAALIALVHDIGQIVLFALGDSYERESRRLHELGLTQVQIEQTLCRVSHAEVGADLLNFWGFPSDMCAAVGHHHSSSPPDTLIDAIIYLAESSMERNEDTYDITKHAQVVDTLGLKQSSFYGVKRQLDGDLSALRAAA